MPEAEAGGHYSLISSRENQHLLSSDNQHVSISSRENQHLISGENQHVPISSRENQQHAQITSDSPLWRLFLDSSCSSASVFLRLQLASAQSYFHSPTPWNPRGSGNVSRKVARLLDSFRPGSTSYCPFPGKNFEPDGNNNNHRAPPQPAAPTLLRPSEVPVERSELRSQPVDIPQPAPPVTPISTPSSLASSPPSSVSREEETRRQLYLPLGRPRPFYSVPPTDQTAHQDGFDISEEAEQRPPVLYTARSLQDEVRAHLVQRLGLVRLEKLLRNGEKAFALPNFLRNTLLTLPCSDFTEDGCASLRSSASYCVRCRLDNRQYLAVFATSEVDKSASNLWEEQRAWLLGLNTELVRHVLALAVDPLTENIFYILDVDRGENLSSLLSRLNPSCSKVCLGDGVVRSCSEAADMIEEGVTRALAALQSVGLTYPGLRQDRVWIQDGQVVLENGLLVKGSAAASPAGDQASLTEELRGHAREKREEEKCEREEG